MDQKRLFQLVAVLAVLVAIAWAAGFLGGSASTLDTPAVEIATAEVHEIAIRKGADEIVVERLDEGSWALLAPVTAAADTTTDVR